MLRDAPHWQPCAMSIRISFEYANLAKLCESAKCLCEFRDLAPSRIFRFKNTTTLPSKAEQLQNGKSNNAFVKLKLSERKHLLSFRYGAAERGGCLAQQTLQCDSTFRHRHIMADNSKKSRTFAAR